VRPCPAVSLLPETFNVLVAPVELMAGAINSHPELQRYKILFISGNYSRILSRLNRNITEQDVRRAFTSFQLITILEENHHSFLIVEHGPLLYEDSQEVVGYLAQALKQTSREDRWILQASGFHPNQGKWRILQANQEGG
jgi:DNA polymerase I